MQDTIVIGGGRAGVSSNLYSKTATPIGLQDTPHPDVGTSLHDHRTASLRDLGGYVPGGVGA